MHVKWILKSPIARRFTTMAILMTAVVSYGCTAQRPMVESRRNYIAFGGIQDHAHSIVYVIDAGGQMTDLMDFLLRELQRSIAALDESQSFSVVFFQGDEVIEPPTPGLKPASQHARAAEIAWIDPAVGNIYPMKGGGCLNALKRALSYHPEVIFLLSENVLSDQRHEINPSLLINGIKKLNNSGTRIHTIQFIYPDDLSLAGLKPTLQIIAEDNHGQYHFLDGKELGI